MKLKPTVKGMKHLDKKEESKRSYQKSENKLPTNEYKPILEPKRLLVRETRSYKDTTKVLKQYLELSVKRIDDDNKDEATPYVWIQMYQESEMYTGYLKGKTVYFPLEMLYDVIEGLNDISDECDKRHIE